MATPEAVQQLRRLTGLAPDDETYTGELLSAIIDDLDGSLDAAAAAVWSERAAQAATLVDVSESGSSRRLSQLADQYRKMHDHFTARADEDVPRGGSFVVDIERV